MMHLLTPSLRRTALAALLPVLAWSAPAVAHPHAFVDTRVTFTVEGGRVAAVHVQWILDEMYGTTMRDDVDTNHDGVLDAGEKAAAAETWATNLSEYGYFTRVGPAHSLDAPVSAVTDFVVDETEDGHMTVRFTVPLPAAAGDASAQPLAVSIYDPDYYLSMEPALEQPVQVSSAGTPCQTTVVEDEEAAYYFGQIIPKRVELSCPAS